MVPDPPEPKRSRLPARDPLPARAERIAALVLRWAPTPGRRGCLPAPAGQGHHSAFIDRRTLGWRERLLWWRAGVAERLETMPPFWMAFSLTLTETVGGGLLALPIALATVGVLFALVLLAVFAVVNHPIAALVEGSHATARCVTAAATSASSCQTGSDRPAGRGSSWRCTASTR